MKYLFCIWFYIGQLYAVGEAGAINKNIAPASPTAHK